jgi:Sugar transferases involved in lipopolysaccharide synthesis
MLLKRITDIVIASSALLGSAPLLLLVAAAIKADSRGPVIFKQKRVGRSGQIFEIYKFRTMATGTPDLPTDQMQKLPSPITKVGSFLRKTSLDELPQLFNVLRGDMSLVGPRPALYNQTNLTAMRDEHGVLEYPPGITGWAQINGRDELPDDVKVELDKWYCDHWSYWLDWRIILSTFGAVLSRRGAY